MRRLAIAFSLVLAACSGDDGDDEAPVDCALETRDDDFAIGLEKVSTSGLHYRLMQSDPAPPARFDNRWTIQVTDTNGAPLAGQTITVTPFMPDHGHGTGVVTVVTESATTLGEYDANPVFLAMPGLHQVFVDIAPTTTPVDNDQVVFAFCIPG
jgi:hypothetical protein